MRYKDNKWLVIKNKKGTEIFCVCPCGFTHDIAFDSKGKLEGSGTSFARTKWGKKMAQQCPQEIKIYSKMFINSLGKKQSDKMIKVNGIKIPAGTTVGEFFKIVGKNIRRKNGKSNGGNRQGKK